MERIYKQFVICEHLERTTFQYMSNVLDIEGNGEQLPAKHTVAKLIRL